MRIGPIDVPIKRWPAHHPEGRSKFGEYDRHLQACSFAVDMPSIFKAVEVILHEFTHAIWDIWKLNTEEPVAEEDAVEVLAVAWAAMYRDNPWLVELLGHVMGLERPTGKVTGSRKGKG